MSEDKKSKQKSVKTDNKKSEQDSATLKEDGTEHSDTEKQDDPKAVVILTRLLTFLFPTCLIMNLIWPARN